MKYYLVASYLLLYSIQCMAQHQTIDFLKEHQKYILLAEGVKEKIETADIRYNFQVHLYGKDNVVIEWKQNTLQSDTHLYLRFMLQPAIFEFRCDKSIKQENQTFIENFIHNFLKKPFFSDSSFWQNCVSNEVLNYLDKADNVAIHAYACNMGDYYQAGLYSEIIITDSYLQLNQINWWNAESLDRKNYCMRKLEFLVPFQENKNIALDILKKEFFEIEIYSFQNMLIGFEDYSAPNYRTCGQVIMVAIKNINQ